MGKKPKKDEKKPLYLKFDGSIDIIDEFCGINYMPYKLKKPKKKVKKRAGHRNPAVLYYC